MAHERTTGRPTGEAGGVISVNQRKYAVGLSWQVSHSDDIHQVARDAACNSRIQMDFFSIRPGNREGRLGQFGLSVKTYGHKRGMPSAAASIAADRPGSWASAFKVPQGIWICVCRDDLITPDGDMLYRSISNARERMIAEIDLGGLQLINAPAEWKLPKSAPIPLQSLLNGRGKGHLRRTKVNVKQVAVVVAVVVCIGIGLLIGSHWSQISQFMESLRPTISR
jgi:hypothetical protein